MLQECNPSTHAVRGLRMLPLPASASSGAGRFAFGNASQPRPKAKNSSSFSLDEVAVNSPALPSGSVMCGFVLGTGNDPGSHCRRASRLGLRAPPIIRGQVIAPNGIQLLFPPKLWLTRFRVIWPYLCQQLQRQHLLIHLWHVAPYNSSLNRALNVAAGSTGLFRIPNVMRQNVSKYQEKIA